MGSLALQIIPLQARVHVSPFEEGVYNMFYSFSKKIILLVFVCIALVGCQPKVYLMPPPLGLQPDSKLFRMTEDNKDGNLLYTLYATNRMPFDPPQGGTSYSIFPSHSLKLGFVVHSVGDEGTSWEELYKQSLQPNRDKDLLLTQVYRRERTKYHRNDDPKKISAGGEGYFDQINRILARNVDKDILVYVHGANSNFYRATAQGAQYHHYTGHNTLVLTFSWPSAENLFKYKVDVLHARQTVPAFARLLELLAEHTTAKKINILAYSAGAQVAAPGLVYLRRHYSELSDAEVKSKFRIGEVYFAAPDTDFVAFVERYLDFMNIVERTTINLNFNDSVLRLSAFQNGVSRLGRPDLSELSEDEIKIMISAMRTPQLDVLNIGGSKALNIGGGHDSWYSHPWVSNDLLLLLLLNADPKDRGLEEYDFGMGAIGYYFPDNYERRIQKILEGLEDKKPEDTLIGTEDML